MDFFGREEDICELRRIRESAGKSARFTVMTGRRRVGKTELLHKAFEDRPHLYFLVTRSAEKDLCAAFQEEYGRVTGRTFPAARSGMCLARSIASPCPTCDGWS